MDKEFSVGDPTPEGRRSFDAVTIAIHWVSALIVVAMFASAWLHAQAQDGALRAVLLQGHRSLGLLLWTATALRLCWRLTKARLPPFPATMTKPHRIVVHLSEYALYALLLFLPAAGLGATILRGRPFALFFWQVPQLLGSDRALASQIQWLHEIGAWMFGALVMAHAGAALFHHFILRDEILQSMAPVLTARRD